MDLQRSMLAYLYLMYSCMDMVYSVDLLRAIDHQVVSQDSLSIAGQDPKNNSNKSTTDMEYRGISCYSVEQNTIVLKTRLKTFTATNLSVVTYPAFMKEMLKSCQEDSLKQGLKYFGIANLKECWAGKEILTNQRTNPSKCLASTLQKCSFLENECIGTPNSIFVYENGNGECVKLLHVTFCPFVVDAVRSPILVTIGCFESNPSKRQLNKLLLTFRDASSPVYAGSTIDWNDYRFFLTGMVNECFKLAQAKKFRFFGVEYYGECWAGNNIVVNSKELPAKCVDVNYKNCERGNQANFCAGKENAVFMYKIIN